MKICVAFATTALIIAASFDSAMGLAKYLDELPNGSSFSQELGHPDNDSSQYTDFATAFADAGHSWTTALCGATFPGSTMTNGAAFGDPCCTWTKGGKADFTVTAFTTTPGEATVCATGGSSASSATASTATSGSAETEAPATEAPTTETPTTDTPSVTTETPTTDTPSVTTETPVTDAPATDPPVASDSASEGSDSSDGSFPNPGGCRVKPHHGGGKHGGGAWQFRLRR